MLQTVINWWRINSKEIDEKAVPSFIFERVEKCVGIVLGYELCRLVRRAF